MATTVCVRQPSPVERVQAENPRHTAVTVARLRINQPVSEAVLKEAVCQTVDKHPNLQLNFKDGCFVQATKELYRFSVETLDREDGWKDVVVREAHADFGLGGDCGLIKFVFVRCPKAEYLVVANHHLIADGISERVVVGDVVDCYSELLTDRKYKVKHLPPLPNALDLC